MTTDQSRTGTGIKRVEIVEGLHRVGLQRGDMVLVHSAMRTCGFIDGGAPTVVDSLLDVLGPTGTLVAPTFTFAHEAGADPIIDPQRDPSEMGIISETVRVHPEASRSIAFRHSLAAIGPRATVVTEVDPSLSPFDLRSSFGVMLGLNCQVLLLGVSYTNSTSHHFAEWVCDVPYRQAIDLTVKLKYQDGSVVTQPMTDYQPKSEGGSYYGSRNPDFNRLGSMLEDRGQVGTAFIGNSAARRFAMRQLVDLARVEAAKDFNIFRTPEGQTDYVTPLAFGQRVLSPQLMDGAGRPHRVEWCVHDPNVLVLPA